MFNWIVNDTFQYLEPFNCVQTKEQCWIELLVLNSNTWSSLSVSLNWIIGMTGQYLKPLNCVRIIVILVCKQINSDSFENKITYKVLTYKWYMYNHLTVWKLVINSK